MKSQFNYLRVLLLLLLFPVMSYASSSDVLSKRAAVYKKIAKIGNSSTVGINCKDADYSHYYGTGVIISSDGYILTSTTVVPRNAQDIVISLANKSQFNAKVIETNTALECCLLKIESKNALSYIPIATSLPKVGERAYSFGNPHNMLRDGKHASFSVGVISGIYPVKSIDSQSTYSGLAIETDAAINPGQDGGPLLNCYGQLIGITSLSYGRSRWQGVAVPIKFILEQLIHLKQKRIKISNDKVLEPSPSDSSFARGLSGQARGFSNKLVEIEITRKYPPEYLERLQLSQYIKKIDGFNNKPLREQQGIGKQLL